MSFPRGNTSRRVIEETCEQAEKSQGKTLTKEISEEVEDVYDISR